MEYASIIIITATQGQEILQQKIDIKVRYEDQSHKIKQVYCSWNLSLKLWIMCIL